MYTEKNDITVYTPASGTASANYDKRSIGFGSILRICITVALLLFAAIALFNGHYFDDLTRALGAEPQGQTSKYLAPQGMNADHLRIDPDRIAREFWQEHHLLIEKCSQQDDQAILRAIADLNFHFEQKREMVPEFLNDLFSLKSKGKMAWYFVRGDGRLEAFLHEKTNHYLGSSNLLQAEVERITNVLKMEIQKNHNQLMLALEADLAELPINLNIRKLSGEDFKRSFNNSFDIALKGMLPRTVGVQLGVETIALAFDIWVASAIGARIAGALATSGIIAGGSAAAGGTAVAGGAALGPWTAGISIAVGIVVAVAIDWVCNEVARADAEKNILAALENWRYASVMSFKAKATRGINHFNDARLLALKKALKKELNLLAQKGLQQ